MDVETMADELSVRDVLGWVQYWRQREEKGAISDPAAAATLLEGIKREVTRANT